MKPRQPRSFIGLARRSFPFWFGGIWLFCGAPFLVIGIYVGLDTLREQRRFEREAEGTQGMVLTKRISRDKNNTTYWVGYRFGAPDGTVVKTETKVSGALWDQLVEREPISVRFLPDEPRVHRIEGQGPDWVLPLVFTLLGLVFVPLGGWIFMTGCRGILRELRLERAGALTEATVVDVGPGDISYNGVPQWRIRYRYHDHRGQARTGRSGLMAPEDAEQWKSGDKGTARFDTRSPQKSIWVGRV